jgi:hypothetical protein
MCFPIKQLLATQKLLYVRQKKKMSILEQEIDMGGKINTSADVGEKKRKKLLEKILVANTRLTMASKNRNTLKKSSSRRKFTKSAGLF